MCRSKTTRLAFHGLSALLLALAIFFVIFAPPATEAWQCFPDAANGLSCLPCSQLDNTVAKKVDWLAVLVNVLSSTVGTANADIELSGSNPFGYYYTTTASAVHTTAPSASTHKPAAAATTKAVSVTSGRPTTTTTATATGGSVPGATPAATATSPPVGAAAAASDFFTAARQAAVLQLLGCPAANGSSSAAAATSNASTDPAATNGSTTAATSYGGPPPNGTSTATTALPSPPLSGGGAAANDPILCCCFPNTGGFHTLDLLSLQCSTLSGYANASQIAAVVLVFLATLFAGFQLLSEAAFRLGAVPKKYRPGVAEGDWASFLATIGTTSRSNVRGGVGDAGAT